MLSTVLTRWQVNHSFFGDFACESVEHHVMNGLNLLFMEDYAVD